MHVEAIHKHINTLIHKQVWYNCDQCDHKAINKYCLKKHAKAKHNEVRYSCGQCEFKVGTKKVLTSHIETLVVSDNPTVLAISFEYRKIYLDHLLIKQ